MNDAFICDAIRTPFGRYGGSLASVRADDLGAVPIKALMDRNPSVDWACVDDVFYGCANQAGEDNRNVARMSGLLAGLPIDVPGMTLNRLCGSGIDAVGTGARAIRSGEADLIIAGGVESMSRAPFAVAKANTAFSRQSEMFDTTIGWRFVNPLMKQQYGVDSMPETAENVAEQFHIDRASQDAFAFSSQTRAAKAQADGIFAEEIVPVRIPQRKKEDIVFAQDEHLRLSSLETLSKLATPFRDGGSVTAGNASGVNDGSCALLLASREGIKHHGLTPKARILGMATAGLEPNIMGYGPVAATLKVLEKTSLSLDQMDVIELNEAFAAQGLAVMRALDIADDAAHVNPNGGAIALGHPLGASGARLVTTAMYQLHRTNGRYALCTMCIGVGQGIALIIERV
ncbi:3-oxoadipyl-CoA thiolase [Candidatus Njordibacter sp. Uisw_039]|jgi:acetyl-CoA acyltransferase|uniref:3-oxoadipyl-CoA thiolase n=1 Tax=Candidatus Njordibacter sp. Uisw_039 TaxID=3230972 RepID=UPI003D45E519|tara:strand:- start:7132 stop:8334 length:1203 start_codon:yes stop_codon:yes gene_type:complete